METLADIFGQDQRPPLGSIFGVRDDRPRLGEIFGGQADFSDVVGGSSTTLRRRRAQAATPPPAPEPAPAATLSLLGPAGDAGAAVADQIAAKRAQLADIRAHGDLGMVPTPDTSAGAVAADLLGVAATTAGNAVVNAANLPRTGLAGAEALGRRAAFPFQASAAPDEEAARLAVARRALDAGGTPASPLAGQLLRQATDDRPLIPDPLAPVTRLSGRLQEEATNRLAESSQDLPTPVAAGLFWGASTAGLMADASQYLGGHAAPFGASEGAAKDIAKLATRAGDVLPEGVEPTHFVHPEDVDALRQAVTGGGSWRIEQTPQGLHAVVQGPAGPARVPLREVAPAETAVPLALGDRSFFGSPLTAHDAAREALKRPITAREVELARAAGVEPVSPGFGTGHDADAYGAWLDRAGQRDDQGLRDRFFELHHPDLPELPSIRETPGPPPAEHPALTRLRETVAGNKGEEPLSPNDLPFELKDLPLTRWQSPGAAGGAHFDLGDTKRWFNDAPRPAFGGREPVSEFFTPQNPLVRVGYPGSGLRVLDDATAAGHDAIITISPNNPENVEVLKTPLAREGTPRQSPFAMDPSAPEAKWPELLKDRSELSTIPGDHQGSPGITQEPERLVVARRMPDGTVRYGRAGQIHADLIDEFDGPVADEEMGFATPSGEFLSRDEAGRRVLEKSQGQLGSALSGRNGIGEGRLEAALYHGWSPEREQALIRLARDPDLDLALGEDLSDPSSWLPDTWAGLERAVAEEPNLLKRALDPPAAVVGAVEADGVHGPQFTTSTKNAVTEAERAARGLPEVEALGRKSSGDNWLAAKAAFEADPEAARVLAAHVTESPRPLNAFENDLLLHDRMKLTLDHRDALSVEEQALAAGDTEGAAAAKIRRTSLEAAMETNDAAAKLSGTAWHESGMARQKLIAEDYSPVHLTTRARVAAAEGGRELPEAVRQQLVETSKQLEAAQAQVAGYQERVSQLEAERAVQAAQRDAARVQRSTGRRASKEALDAEYRDLSARFASLTNRPRAGLDPELAGLVARMARNRVQAGAKGLAEVVDGIYQDLSPHVEDLEPRDVRDAISGYGVTRTHPAQTEAAQELARIRQEARTLSAYEDAIAAGRPPAELDPLRQQVDRISAGTALPGRGPLSDAERLSATKARLARREQELTQQFAEGNFPKKVRRPLSMDPEAIALQGRVEELKAKAESIIRREELKNRSVPEKALDATANWGRFLKLTGTATLQKIGAAAAERALVFKPLEEFIGAGVSKIPGVKQFAAQAPIEGGGSLKAVAKSYAGFFGQQARAELAAGLKGQEGAFSLAMSGAHPETGAPAWMQYPGRVHAGLKAPAKIAAYEYAMQKQAEHFLGLGQPEALSDLGKIAEMKARAYEYANRDIFMGDNAAVRKFRNAFRDEPGQSLAAKATNTTANVLMPIVKVPTNYALEATHYLAGIPKAGVKMGNVVAKGVKATAGQEDRQLADIVKAGLDALAARKGGASAADQADQIMMNLKKGSLGAGLIALGATGAVKVGGYYHPGEHRSEDELKPGQVQIGGHDTGIVIPHNLLHHPAVEALQVGGTIYRAKTLGQGLEDSAWGVAEQVPFLEEPLTAGRDLRKNPSKFLGQFERGMTLPPDAQRLARVLDQKEETTTGEKVGQYAGFGGLRVGSHGIPEIEPVKRNPRGGFLEKMKKEEDLGIPGLRPRAGGPPP